MAYLPFLWKSIKGELAHRLIKKFYGLTSKCKCNVLNQLAWQACHLTHIQCQLQTSDPPVFEVSDVDTIPELHYVLSNTLNHIVNLKRLIYNLHTECDPAVKVMDNFISKLKHHLLTQLYQYEYDRDEQQFSDAQHSHLHFVDNLNHVVESKTFCVNYTSYNIHHQQDFMQPGHGCAIMTLSSEDGPDAHNHSQQTMEVLWVHWLGIQPGYQWGFKEAHLPKVGFIPDSDENTFGFLDPSLVIHACHLIPAFSEDSKAMVNTHPDFKNGSTLSEDGDDGEQDDLDDDNNVDEPDFEFRTGLQINNVAGYKYITSVPDHELNNLSLHHCRHRLFCEQILELGPSTMLYLMANILVTPKGLTEQFPLGTINQTSTVDSSCHWFLLHDQMV
ncbi:hypothetical protein BS17DRAFT_769641 [Gyrodon lividus]|nr:hypothetical protein BS17DRAFT_769641 [Gyrodon lividus]